MRLPPKYVNAPASAVYTRGKKPIVLTYIRLRGLAWQNDYQYTPPMPIEELMEVVELERRAFYQHLHELREMGWLRSESPQPGYAVLHFALEPTSVQKNAQPLVVVNPQELSSSAPEEDQHHLVLDPEGGMGGNAVSAEIRTALRKSGVSGPAAQHLCEEYPPEELRRRLRIFGQARARGAALGVGWLVDSIVHSWPIPEWYQPDPDDPDERRRYAESYARYTQD